MQSPSLESLYVERPAMLSQRESTGQHRRGDVSLLHLLLRPYAFSVGVGDAPTPPFELGRLDNRPNRIDVHADESSGRPFVPRVRDAGQPPATQLPLVAGPTPEQEWLQLHRDEYAGQWVVLDGHRLIAAGPDGKSLFRIAKEAGVKSPFLVFLEKDPLPFGGW